MHHNVISVSRNIFHNGQKWRVFTYGKEAGVTLRIDEQASEWEWTGVYDTCEMVTGQWQLQLCAVSSDSDDTVSNDDKANSRITGCYFIYLLLHHEGSTHTKYT